jgi:hypothetical protein
VVGLSLKDYLVHLDKSVEYGFLYHSLLSHQWWAQPGIPPYNTDYVIVVL